MAPTKCQAHTRHGVHAGSLELNKILNVYTYIDTKIRLGSLTKYGSCLLSLLVGMVSVSKYSWWPSGDLLLVCRS